MVLLIKQHGHVYMHVIFVLTFFLFVCFLVASCQKFRCFFRVYNCVCKFDKITKNYEKKEQECKIQAVQSTTFFKKQTFS